MNTRKDNLIAGVIAVAMIALVFACIKAGGDEQKKTSTKVPPPLLVSEVKEAAHLEMQPIYPFKRTVKLEGVYLGELATNTTEQAGTNGEIIRVLNVVAKLSIQALWDSNILQWNYDKPVSQITNRYKLVR